MRSAWPKISGEAMWPSICCRPMKSSADPHRGERVLEERHEQRRHGAQERARRTGTSSMSPNHTPKASA